MIEWKGNLINEKTVEFLKYQTYYADAMDMAYGGGSDCAYIFIKDREKPVIVECSKDEFNILKDRILNEAEGS